MIKSVKYTVNNGKGQEELIIEWHKGIWRSLLGLPPRVDTYVATTRRVSGMPRWKDTATGKEISIGYSWHLRGLIEDKLGGPAPWVNV